MRVIAGQLGGRQFDSPHTERTHPMGDRVRGALFNALGDVSGMQVLDAFAGSGALAFEALSRGAAQALLIDNDTSSQITIRHNIAQLDLAAKARLVAANCSSWSDLNPTQQFDIVFADPPYQQLQLSLIEKLVRHVTPGGFLVLSWPGKQALPELSEHGLELVRQKSYGDAQLAFYQKS
jgi:16S rRNA (guanine966-N2)-methyltransferase